MTRTAVGLMCLQCGQLEHAPAQPEVHSLIHIEHISNSSASSSGAIDGLRDNSGGKSLLKPQINRAATATSSPRRSGLPRSAKLAVGIGTMVAVVITLSWLSLQANQKTVLKTAPLANLAVSTNQTKPTLTKTNPQSLSRDTTRKQDLTQLATALNVYYKQTGKYPAGKDIGALLNLETTSPPYLQQIPVDPMASTAGYGYQYQSNGGHFTLQAKLENSQDPQSRNGYFVISQ